MNNQLLEIEKEPPGNNFHKALLKENISLPITSCIPKIKINKHIYENGVSHLLPRLKLKVHSEIEDCFKLWDLFSPKDSLFDLWDFRYAWNEGYKNKPFFYTVYEGKKPVAVLPLSYQEEKKRFEWFGTNWMEDNKFFVGDYYFTDLLIATLPFPIHLNAIEPNELKNIHLTTQKITKDDPKNLKGLSKFKRIEELLLSFKKKRRYNLKHDYRKIKIRDPIIVKTFGKQFELLDLMIKTNIKQFSVRKYDESDLVIAERAETYKNIIKNSGVYKPEFIEIIIDGRLAGIELIITYKDRYYAIKGGMNMDFKGISNFVMYSEFEDAIKRGYTLFDCLQIDYGWKHRYFEQKPLYLLEK